MIQPCSTHHFSMAKAAFLRLTFQQAQGMRHVAQVLREEMILPGPAGPAGSCFWVFLGFLEASNWRFFWVNL